MSSLIPRTKATLFRQLKINRGIPNLVSLIAALSVEVVSRDYNVIGGLLTALLNSGWLGVRQGWWIYALQVSDLTWLSP